MKGEWTGLNQNLETTIISLWSRDFSQKSGIFAIGAIDRQVHLDKLHQMVRIQ